MVDGAQPDPSLLAHRGSTSVTDRNPLSRRGASLPQSSTVRIADLAAEMRRAGEPVIDLSAGRAAESTDDAICEAARAALAEGDTHQTPARGTPDYLASCAEKLARMNGLVCDPQRELIATAGCKHGLLLTLLATLDPGDEVLLENPGFVSYAPTITLCGGTPVAVALRPEAGGYRWSEAALEAAISPRTRAILFCSPHNPTGTVHTESDLATIAGVAQRHDLLVIADEIYEAVTWDGRKHLPIATLDEMSSRTVGLMGLTKSYSMGGWRVGYAYGPEPVIGAMVKQQQHLMTCVSSIAQRAAAAALGAQITDSMERLWRDWEDRCAFVASELDADERLGAVKPQGGFYVWTDIRRTGLESAAFAESLLAQQSVTVVPGSSFGPAGEGFVRITAVKSWPDLKESVSRIKAFLDKGL